MIAMRLQLVPLLALGLAVSAAGPASAQKRPPTPDEFFGEFKGKMIQDANQLDPWRQLAQNAARKTASDFVGPALRRKPAKKGAGAANKNS